MTRSGFVGLSFVTALLGIAAIAFAVSRVVSSQIATEARASAEKEAALIGRAAFGPALVPDKLRSPQLERQEFRQAADAAHESLGVLQMTIYNRRGVIMYDVDQHLVGTRTGMSARLREALAGRPSSLIVSGGDPAIELSRAKRIETLVPIEQGGHVAGVVHVDTPYAPVRADIAHRVERIQAILAGAGALLYIALLPVLLRVGRRLSTLDRRQGKTVKDLRTAIDQGGQIALHYQPIVDFETGEVRAVEALVRWTHPARGLIPPDRLLREIEGTPVFWDFTVHVLDLAISQAARWYAAGRPLSVAINVSVGDVLDPRLPETIESCCAKHRLPARLVELELTEQAIMERIGDALEVIATLRRTGVGIIAIDDFGTGYSSLARVRDLPIQALKIDRSFIAEMGARQDPALVRSVISLAHNLGLHVIAEGIETAEAWAQLKMLGCDAGQGYLIARPQSARAFERWYEAHDPAAFAELADALAPDRRAGPGRRVDDNFAAAFDHAPDAIVLLDNDGRWMYANAAAEDLFGVERQLLVGRHVGPFLAGEEQSIAEHHWLEARRHGSLRTRLPIKHPDGVREVDVHVAADPQAQRHIAIFREVAPA